MWGLSFLAGKTELKATADFWFLYRAVLQGGSSEGLTSLKWKNPATKYAIIVYQQVLPSHLIKILCVGYIANISEY